MQNEGIPYVPINVAYTFYKVQVWSAFDQKKYVLYGTKIIQLNSFQIKILILTRTPYPLHVGSNKLSDAVSYAWDGPIIKI